MTTLNGRTIAVPHLMICRVERAIVVDERARYTAHESGNALREAELDLELSILLREYFNRTGRTYHSQFPHSRLGSGKGTNREYLTEKATSSAQQWSSADNYSEVRG